MKTLNCDQKERLVKWPAVESNREKIYTHRRP